MFNVSNFRAELNKKDLLRPNLFHVQFSLPSGLLNVGDFARNQEAVSHLQYWCEGTSLPGVILQTYQGQQLGYGPIEQRPLLHTYSEPQFTFIFDSASTNHNLFYDWINLIINTDFSEGPNAATKTSSRGFNETGTQVYYPSELSYKEEYVVDLRVVVFDSTGIPAKVIVLRDAFPKAIGDISLSWMDNNSYMRLPIQFAYTDWYQETPTEYEQTLNNQDYYTE